MTYWRNNSVLLAACLLVTGIGLEHSSTTLAQSSGLVNPLTAIDLNPDPDVVEIQLVAREDVISFGTENLKEVYAYNGSIPGPTIEGKIGDTLIVHFTNLLPEPTTIHWHGLELPANMDGSHIAQHPIPAGGTFRYEFKFLRASTFWYHPHIRTNEQVEKGLYGMMVVRDSDEDQSLGLPELAHQLVLDDVLLDENGQIVEPFPADPLENAETQVNGRIGNTLLVNGKPNAVGTVERGVPQRLRLVNTANARFMRVSISGHRMFRIGGDGGLLEAPIEIQPVELIADPDDPAQLISDPDPTKGLLLTPGERADVVFTPGGENPTIAVEWHDIARGRQQASLAIDGTIVMSVDETDGKRPPRTLLTLELVGEDGGDEFVPEAALRDIEPIDATGAEPIPVTFGHSRPDANGDSTFFVFQTPGMPMPFELITPEIAPMVTVGDTRIWEIRNVTAGDHNFHSHGFTFQLIDTRYEDEDNPSNNFIIPAAYLEDKDTILLPGRPGARARSRTVTRLAATFHDTGREGEVEAFGKEPGDDTSGGWVFHCHILEHADRGMMSFLQVKNFQINAGLNDAWVNADAPFQGMFITVFPVLKLVFLSWFTFDSEQPPEDVTAVFGAPDQRWATALGFYDGNRAELKAELTTGGKFNTSDPLPTQNTKYGTINVEFANCKKGSVEFDFPSTGESGTFSIQRVLESNVALCDALNSK
jgi:FtsP/CotA-like multicopper oxidase with cupredoxin domain